MPFNRCIVPNLMIVNIQEYMSLSGLLNLKDWDRCGAEVYLKTDGRTDKGLTIHSVHD